jgi:hypothetical protein
MILSKVENSHQGILDYQLSFLHLRDDRVLTAMRLISGPQALSASACLSEGWAFPKTMQNDIDNHLSPLLA